MLDLFCFSFPKTLMFIDSVNLKNFDMTDFFVLSSCFSCKFEI
jgi:hypothetical protein